MIDPTPEYEALPDSVRAYYTAHQFAWLSDADKARVIQTETEPEFD